uniref:C3H1-type domain-containing protein n=1 Tax=Alexandrium monilatum TaxID=311494 RepID=A0A7S4QL84_9DINO
MASSARSGRGSDGGSQPELLSEGSRFHLAGKCKPCAFFHSKGCLNGPACTFCHECPPHEAKRRQRVRRQLLRPLQGHSLQQSDESSNSTTSSRRARTSSLSRQSSLETPASMGKESHELQSWIVSAARELPRSGPCSSCSAQARREQRWMGAPAAKRDHAETDAFTVISTPSIGVSVHLPESLPPLPCVRGPVQLASSGSCTTTSVALQAASLEGSGTGPGHVQCMVVPMLVSVPPQQQQPRRQQQQQQLPPQQQRDPPRLPQQQASPPQPEWFPHADRADVTAAPTSGCESPATAAGY